MAEIVVETGLMANLQDLDDVILSVRNMLTRDIEPQTTPDLFNQMVCYLAKLVEARRACGGLVHRCQLILRPED